MIRIDVFSDAQWPLPVETLHWAYLVSGLLIAAHYVPLLLRAWRHVEATATAQSLATWAVWSACRMVALAYAIFVLHDLLFLIVVGADVAGRLAMVTLILRARLHVRLKQQILADYHAATSSARLSRIRLVHPRAAA